MDYTNKLLTLLIIVVAVAYMLKSGCLCRPEVTGGFASNYFASNATDWDIY